MFCVFLFGMLAFVLCALKRGRCLGACLLRVIGWFARGFTEFHAFLGGLRVWFCGLAQIGKLPFRPELWTIFRAQERSPSPHKLRLRGETYPGRVYHK